MTLVDSSSFVASATGMRKAEASKAVSAVVHGIQDALRKGEKVSTTAFGTFEVWERPDREGPNPQTGQSTKTAPSKAGKSNPGKALKAAVNG